ADYMMRSKAQFLFGCGSVKITDPRQAALLYKYFLEDNRIMPEYLSPPTKKYKMPKIDLWMKKFANPLTEAERTEAAELVPPLLRSYLKIGCYIGGEPAWDKKFKCIDFLTILRKEDLNKSLWKKYKMDSDSSTDS
ncbi:MAG: GNAT family N-acetyltransferase, partial [Bdellovibrionota bacterium]